MLRVWNRPSGAALATRSTRELVRRRTAPIFPVSVDEEADWSVGVVEATGARRGAAPGRRDGGTELLRTPWWPRERNTESFLKRFTADGRFVPTRPTLISASRYYTHASTDSQRGRWMLIRSRAEGREYTRGYMQRYGVVTSELCQLRDRLCQGFWSFEVPFTAETRFEKLGIFV